LASIFAGHEMTNGSLVPPRNVSFFHRLYGVFPALAHPQA
jgi:hypothetical protein